MKYRKEKFESRDEALIWCADNKPIYSTECVLFHTSRNLPCRKIVIYWGNWHKAIPIETETVKKKIEGERLQEMKTYLYKHLEYMWGSKLLSMIYECDFRDAGRAYERECEE